MPLIQNGPTKDTLTARRRFRMRTFKNAMIVVGTFVPLAIFFSFFPFSWLADAVLIGILFWVFFGFLELKPIGIICPNCRAYVASNTPWYCGNCPEKKLNLNVDAFPFVHKCEHCGVEPKSYRCHHCKLLIYFSEDMDTTRFAYSVIRSEEPHPRQEQRKQHELTVEEKREKIAIAKLDDELNKINISVNGIKLASPMEQRKKDFDATIEMVMGLREHAESRMAQAEMLFKDDPKNLKKMKRAIKFALGEDLP